MHDWQVLGLQELTDDLALIKRSYAARLKVTRPDDDALAYQALREAYDRMVAWARHRQAVRAEAQVAATTAEPAPVASVAPIEPAVEPAIEPAAISVPVEMPAAESLSPEALCELVTRTVPQGPAALEALVPVLRRQLNDLPLGQEAEASARFADLVLRTPLLPSALLLMLQAHFDWLDDFRTVRLIGAWRAQALHDALAGLKRPLTDEQLLRKHADLVAMQALLERGRSMRSLLLATLMGLSLPRQIAAAGPTLMTRIGFDAGLLADLVRTLKIGEWMRTLAVALAIFVLGAVITHDPGEAVTGTWRALGVTVGTVIPLLLAFGLLYGMRRRGNVLPAAWIAHWRRRAPWYGVAMILGAALVWQYGPDGYEPAVPLLAIILLLAGLMLSAPQEPGDLLLAATLGGYLIFSLQLQGFPAGALAVAWVLAGVHVHLQRRWTPGERLYADTQGRVAMLLLATVLLPTFFAWMGGRWGTRLMLAALLLALTPALVLHPVEPVFALPAALAAVLGMSAVQRQSQRFARWLAARS
jgi:hypothetical protein